jgi:hypothetical protein
MNHRHEFSFLAVVSIPLWVVFEGYNLLIRNWHYVNLPENAFLRYFGYAWAFATISPAIFETGELIDVFRRRQRETPPRESHRQLSTRDYLWIAAGTIMLVCPLISPSPYQGAMVFLGFIFLLDPINRWLSDESLLGDFDAGKQPYRRLTNLLWGGLICGVLWEFWNYWSRAKWIYDVPIMQQFKIFEMPLAGYFGFPPFAVECFTMYVFIRHLLWRGRTRPIAV